MDQSNGWTAQLRRRVEPAVRRAQTGQGGADPQSPLIEVHFLDRTVILAGQAFSALLPLIMVVNTVSPHPGGDSPAAALFRRLGLDTKDVAGLSARRRDGELGSHSIGVRLDGRGSSKLTGRDDPGGGRD